MVLILDQVAYILFVVIKPKTYPMSLKSRVCRTGGGLQRQSRRLFFPTTDQTYLFLKWRRLPTNNMSVLHSL